MVERRAIFLRRIDKLWRIFATGLSFFIFGLGALCLTFIVFPIVTLSIKDRYRREMRVQSIIQKSFDFFCRTMRFLGAIDYGFEGIDILQQDRRCLVIANHPSLIDYVLIASCLPQCDCLVKSSIWYNPFMKGIVKAAGYIPNRDPNSLLDDCAERLQDGNLLLIFPEGTRTPLGEPVKLQRGAAQIAVRTKTDLRLIHITVKSSFLTKEMKWYQVPDTKPFFRVEVKDKIAIAPFLQQSDSPAAAARRLNHHIDSVLFPRLDDNKTVVNESLQETPPR